MRLTNLLCRAAQRCGSDREFISIEWTRILTATLWIVMVCLATEVSAMAQRITGLTLNPTTVQSGSAVTGTVMLSAPAPAQGVQVQLNSTNANLAPVPASFTITNGHNSGTFTINTNASATSATVTIGAMAGGGTATAMLNLTPANVAFTLTLNPATVFAGQNSTGTITLSQPAPVGGLSFSLGSNSINATPPAQINIVQGAIRGSFIISTSAVQTAPSTATIQAMCNNTSATAVLTMNVYKQLPTVTSLRCSNLAAAQGNSQSSISIAWNFAPPTPAVPYIFVWNCTYVPPLTPISSVSPDHGGTTTNQSVVDSFAYNFGAHYIYSVYAAPSDPNNLVNGYRYTDGPTSSITVVPESLPLTDNQTVDARYDLRYSTYTFQNHNFGSSIYRGGLYVGNATDPSRMGRSFLRFGAPNTPMDSYNHWYLPVPLVCWTAGMGVYFTGAAQTNTSGLTVGAQFVADNGWTNGNLCWSSAPPFDPTMPTSTVSVAYNQNNPVFGWCNFPLNDNATTSLSNTLATTSILCAALAVTTESSDQQSNTSSWMYFAKREWNAAYAPYLLFAWSQGPQVTLMLSQNSVAGGQSLTGTLTCNGLYAPLTLTMYAEDAAHVGVPATVTIPTGGSVTFPITTQPGAPNSSVRIIFDYNNWATLQLTQ